MTTPALPSEPEAKPTRRDQLTSAQIAVIEEFEYPYAEAIKREHVKDDMNVFAMAAELTHLRAKLARCEGDAGIGCAEIARERAHQVERWGVDADDKFAESELVSGAIAKAVSAMGWPARARTFWPHNLTCRDPFNGTPRQLLVEAGAMIAAEIDRMDRAARSAHAAPDARGT
jgi:hypothetical protein